MSKQLITALYMVPGLPHLLAAEQSPQGEELRQAYGRVGKEIAASEAEVILYFSSQWFSVLGTMVQGRREISGKQVDGNWHHLGTLPYHFIIDTSLAELCCQEISASGVPAKLIDYQGFPVDTGCIVAQTLLNPDARLASAIVSFNIYSNEAAMVALGEACRQAVEQHGKKVAVVVVSGLSQHFFTEPMDPRADAIYSAGDDQWNRRILDLMEQGKLDEVVALCPEFAQEAAADLGFKAICWLRGMCAANPLASAAVYSYQAIWGTGAGVCKFTLAPEAQLLAKPRELGAIVVLDGTKAPAPVGAYPHARRVGNQLFLSGIGPRLPEGRGIAGVEWDEEGKLVAYDISLQVRQVFANIAAILEEFSLGLDAIVDVQVFLTAMKNDFADFNRVYAEYFDLQTGPTRTTVEVGALPTPIAVEFKVIAEIR